MSKMILALATVTFASSGLAASQASITPGNWETTLVLTDLTLPSGTPPEVDQMLRATLGGEGDTSTSCVTQEQIDNAPEQIFAQTDGQCSYSEFNMSGGVIDAVATCDSPSGPMDMTISGTYTSDTYAMTMNVAGDGGMIGMMELTFDVTGRLVGQCPSE